MTSPDAPTRAPRDDAPGTPPDTARERDAVPLVRAPGQAGEHTHVSTAVRRDTPRRERFIHAVVAVGLIYNVYYIIWRWTDTLNPDALWFSIPLVAAETWGILTFGALVFTAWKLKRRPHRPAPPGLSVDVFITTYDEPVEVVRKTAAAARAIRYPHTTYLLDDGCRPEMRAMAQDLGIEYIQRESSEHAKAGNLNNALGLTDGEFILQLDADHAPLPHILDRLLGHFDDPDVAFVQSPQDFYNTDSFTHVVDEKGRQVWEEQRIFFSIIQPGKDHHNAAFFCGSCGVIRRAALEDIGGFSTETITEDMETSMLLHARGWKSAYVAESLAFGLSPGSASAYQVQRLRWGQGSMQILRRFNPLTFDGLTWAQRICYLSSVTCYFDGLQKAVFLAAPLIFFFTGALPVATLEFEFLVRFFPYLFLSILSFELIARGHGYLWISERFNMARWPIYIRALTGFFAKDRLPFNVTPKGADKVPVRTYIWQLALLVLSPVAVVFATVAHSRGWIDYTAPGWASGAFILNTFWVLWNAYFAWQVIRMARAKRQQDEYFFPSVVPLRLWRTDAEGVEAWPSTGVTEDMHSGAAHLLCSEAFDVGTPVRLSLDLATGHVEVPATVTRAEPAQRGDVELHRLRVDFDEPDLETRLQVELHCVHDAVPAKARRYLYRPDFFDDVRRYVSSRRDGDRRAVDLPAQMGVVEDEAGATPLRWQPAVLEEVGESGMRLVVTDLVELGAHVRVQVPGSDRYQAAGVVSRIDTLLTPVSGRWILGVDTALGSGGGQPSEGIPATV